MYDSEKMKSLTYAKALIISSIMSRMQGRISCGYDVWIKESLGW